MIIDTHCHYNLEPLSNNVALHWQKAQDAGVTKTIVVGTDLENSKKALELSNQFSGFYSSIGLHPNNYTDLVKKWFKETKIHDNTATQLLQQKINKVVKKDLTKLTTLLTTELKNKDCKLLAIGEIGLDFYQLKLKGLKREIIVKAQQEAFKQQLQLAWNNNLVAIVHVRDQRERYTDHDNAYLTTLKIIEQVAKNYDKNQHHFILHCISGPLDYIKQAIKLGAYFGIGGNVTYKNADDVRAIVKILPQESILLETDAPYLAPNKMTEVCEPFMIKVTADFLHQELGLELDIIQDNANKAFYGKLD